MNPSKGMEAAEAEIEGLRASNAALIAENEALKQSASGDRNTIRMLSEESRILSEENDKLKQERNRYRDWQPSDPGTKEAVEWAETLIANPKDYGIEDGPAKPHLEALVRSTRAAMVRLEEAEKEKFVNEGMWAGEVEQERKRAEAAESQVSALTKRLEEAEKSNRHLRLLVDDGKIERDALTASLASMTKERDCFKHALAVEIKGDHAEECDCLDHHRAAEKLLSDFKSFDSYIENLYTVDQYKRRAESAKASLAELRKRMAAAESDAAEAKFDMETYKTRALNSESRSAVLEKHLSDARAEHEDCDSKRSQANIEWNALSVRKNALEKELWRVREAYLIALQSVKFCAKWGGRSGRIPDPQPGSKYCHAKNALDVLKKLGLYSLAALTQPAPEKP